jgi:hypothetical protein
MSDKYFHNVEVTVRDWNDNYGRSETMSDDDIIRLADSLKAIRRAELRLRRTVDRVCNPYG